MGTPCPSSSPIAKWNHAPGFARAAAAVSSCGVFKFCSRARSAGRGRTRLARNVRASDWSENRFASIAAATTGSAAARASAKGKPAPSSVSVKAPLPFRLATVLISFGDTNGMSHERNTSRSARLEASAVQTPPIGPHRGTRSRRITRTGQPVSRAAARTQASNVRPRNRTVALSRPMRVLRPPAKMITSTGST